MATCIPIKYADKCPRSLRVLLDLAGNPSEKKQILPSNAGSKFREAVGRMNEFKRAVLYPGDLHNLGDLALLLQCVAALRTVEPLKDVEMLASIWLPLDPEIVRQLDAAEIGTVSRKNLRAALRARAGALNVWSGGQLVRNNASVKSLFGLCLGETLDRLSGARVVVVGCGVGEVGLLRKALFRWALRGAGTIAVRDARSLRCAEQVFGGKRVVLTEDLIHLETGPVRLALTTGGHRRHALFVLCEDASEGRCVEPNSVLAVARYLLFHPSVNGLRLMAHDIRPRMDALVVSRNAEMLRTQGIDVTATITADLDTVLNLYRGARYVVTNRLHAILFGLISGAGVIVLNDGNPKVLQAAKDFYLPVLPTPLPTPQDLRSVFDAADRRICDSHGCERLAAASRAAARNIDLVRDLL